MRMPKMSQFQKSYARELHNRNEIQIVFLGITQIHFIFEKSVRSFSFPAIVYTTDFSHKMRSFIYESFQCRVTHFNEF